MKTIRAYCVAVVLAALLMGCGGDYPTPGPDEEYYTYTTVETVCHPEYMPSIGILLCLNEDVKHRGIRKKAV